MPALSQVNRFSALAVAAAFPLVAACGRSEPPADDGAIEVSGATELEQRAKLLVDFLRGAAAFDEILFADTVVLYLAPEGGGARSTFTRQQLRDPASWKVTSGSHTYSFVPPGALTKMTTKVGRHFNCMEYSLSSRFPELAPMPHVGVKLEREPAESCLQSWNVTFIFEPTAQPYHLVAAVYDQWEW